MNQKEKIYSEIEKIVFRIKNITSELAELTSYVEDLQKIVSEMEEEKPEQKKVFVKSNKIETEIGIPEKKVVKTTNDETKNNLNEKLEDNMKNITNAAKKLSHSHIEDLTKAINLNQRLAFIKFLFAEKNEEFENAIKKLNSAGSMENADKCIASIKNENWKKENELAEEFINLIHRRWVE